jgi:hypothetical protein
MSYEPPALYVAWRDPESRRIYPVGRLLRLRATSCEPPPLRMGDPCGPVQTRF